MGAVLQDFRFGLRKLRRNPGFTATAILTLAGGIAAITAVFSLANAYLFRPLPFHEPESLVHIWETDSTRGDREMRASAPNFLDWRRQATTIEALGAYYYSDVNVSADAEPVQVVAGRVTPDLMRLLAVKPLYGRLFLPEEAQPGRDKVVLLSHGYWRNHFREDPGAVGRTLRLDGETYTVAGVMPEEFVFPFASVRLWTPLALAGGGDRAGSSLLVVGRLKPGITLPQAQEEMNAIARRLEAAYPDTNRGRGVQVVPLRQALVFFFQQLRILVTALLVAAGFVLLIVCANLSGLLLARGVGRAREMSMRLVLGAGRWRLVRQLLIESSAIALLGGALGVLLSASLTDALTPVLPEDIYRVGKPGVDVAVLLFTLVISTASLLLFALAPALEAARRDPNAVLKEAGGGTEGRRGRKLRSALVASQLALASLLLAAAGGTLVVLVQLQRVDLGLRPGGVLTVSLAMPRGATEARVAGFYRDLLARVETLPGVERAAAVNPLPLNFERHIEEFSLEASPEKYSASRFTVTPGYHAVMGVPILEGRGFFEQDRTDTQPVVVVSRTLARAHWPNRSAVGRRIRLHRDGGAPVWAAIIGVAGDSKDFLLHEPMRPQIYLAQSQFPSRRRFLVLRAQRDPAALAAAVRRAVMASDSTVAATEVRTMSEVVNQVLGPAAVLQQVMDVLAAASLLLSIVGVYGVVAQSAVSRRREIGIRLSLGADRAAVVRLMLKQGLALTAVGSGLGLAGSLAAIAGLNALLGGLGLAGALALLAGPVLLALAAMAASWVPALRASRLEPMAALRHE